MIFWKFFYIFQINRRTWDHSDSLKSLIYRYNRLLFEDCINISKEYPIWSFSFLVEIANDTRKQMFSPFVYSNSQPVIQKNFN